MLYKSSVLTIAPFSIKVRIVNPNPYSFLAFSLNFNDVFDFGEIEDEVLLEFQEEFFEQKFWP